MGINFRAYRGEGDYEVLRTLIIQKFKNLEK